MGVDVLIKSGNGCFTNNAALTAPPFESDELQGFDLITALIKLRIESKKLSTTNSALRSDGGHSRGWTCHLQRAA
jgi:hypothetical protein